MSDDQPDWDSAMAEALVGSLVLIGITFVGDDGADQEQMFGTVTDATRKGIEIALEGSRAGETYRLPPDTRAFFPATRGEYRLRSTGEVVVDPDFTTTWSVQRPH